MKKKGFTLIELLAVIVILAIIALITVPTILGVIDKARKESFKDSVYGIINAADLYVASNLEGYDIEFICDGSKCYSGEEKLNFKGKIPTSGTVLIENDGNIKVSFLSDGKYCANGTIKELKISEDCINLDETKPEIDEAKIKYSSTNNSININLFSDFAIDKESGIKEYEITVNNEIKKVEYKTEEEKISFTKLNQNTEYEVIIKVRNNNNIENKMVTKIKTLTLSKPSIVLSNIPTLELNGYYKSQVAAITYEKENMNTANYYMKTTREARSNLSVTKICGSDELPGLCNDINETKILEENVWYQVDDDINVIYDENADNSAKIYAVVYDGTNYSDVVEENIGKIDEKLLTVEDDSLIKNLMEDGEFNNSDISDWYNASHPYSWIDGTIRIDLNNSQAFLRKNLSTVSGVKNHILYARVSVYKNNISLHPGLYVYTADNFEGWPLEASACANFDYDDKLNTWKNVSCIFTDNNHDKISNVMLAQANNNGVGTIYYNNFLIIDLTAIFGAGNEPTQEWCDKNIFY